MKLVSRFCLGLLAVLVGVSPALAANRDVCPTCTYTGINAAVSAAVNGDTIRVAAGTYTGYLNDISISHANTTLVFEGGYNNTFTTRDGETILSNVAVQVSPFFSGSVTFDGFSITGSSTAGIYFASGRANLTVRNCHIYNNSTAGIMVYPYYDYTVAQTIEITNNVIEGSTTGGIFINIGYGDPYPVYLNIADNVISTTGGFHGAGIEIVDSADSGSLIVTRNESFNNLIGAYIQMYGHGSTLDVSYNSFYGNTQTGLHLWGTANNTDPVTVHHNLIYSNGIRGIYHHTPLATSYYNNTIAKQDIGMQLVANAGSPTIVNNIFYDHTSRSIFFSSDDAGWGATNIIPLKMRYNNIYNPGRPVTILHTGLAPAYSYHEEIGGSWANYNQWAWSGQNFSEDPRFVNAATDNYRLASDSFCIDEGDPSDTYSSEPGSNGGRINLGAYGNSVDAEQSPSAVVASNLSAAQSGNDLTLSFNTTTSVQTTWVKAEYWNGSSYQEIPPAALAGTGYSQGYMYGRMPTGASRSLSWTNAHATYGDIESTNLKVRLTAFHGTQGSVVESGNFTVDYVPPTVQITSPTNGAYIAASGTTFAATASDSGSGVAAVQFRYKEQAAGAFTDLNSDSSAPYSGNLSSLSLTPGSSYVLQAIATDGKGQSAVSSNVTVTVCSYSLGSASAEHAASAANGSLTLNTPGGSCAWTVQSNASWITLTSAESGSGSATVAYSVAANASSTARSGTITIAGQTFTVQQAAAECTFSLLASDPNYTAAAGAGTLSVIASGSDCTWNVSKNVPWVNFTSASSGTGSGSVTYAVSANPVQVSRNGSLSLGSQQIAINQLAALPPMLVPSSESVSLSARRKKQTIKITNSSSQVLRITGIALSGSAVFSRSSVRFPLSIKPRKSKNLSISFKSKSRGQFSGTVTVFTDDPNRPSFEIALAAIR